MIRFVIEEKHGFNKLEDSMLKIRFVIKEKHGFNKLERYNARNINVSKSMQTKFITSRF